MIGTKSMRQMQRRLRALERVATGSGQDDPPWAVVIYDGATGEPLQPVPPGAVFQVWLPAKRYEVGDEAEQAAALTGA